MLIANALVVKKQQAADEADVLILSWIRGQLETLAAMFGIEVLGFAVMSNHLQFILRSRSTGIPDTGSRISWRCWLSGVAEGHSAFG